MRRTLIPAKANGATIIQIFPLVYRNCPQKKETGVDYKIVEIASAGLYLCD